MKSEGRARGASLVSGRVVPVAPEGGFRRGVRFFFRVERAPGSGEGLQGFEGVAAPFPLPFPRKKTKTQSSSPAAGGSEDDEGLRLIVARDGAERDGNAVGPVRL